MKSLLPWLCALAVFAGCSRSTETLPAPAAAETPQAAAPTPPAAGYAQVPADLLPRLVRPDSPVLGPPNAPVMLVEFLDPACEACRAFAPVVTQVKFLYPKEVRVVLRFADFHPGSEEAIRILLAAQLQGRLESVLAALFEDQEQWASHVAPNIDAAWKIAGRAGLDLARARKDASSAQVSKRLDQEAEDIMALEVSSTPTFYVNDKMLTDYGPAQLMKLVGSEVKAAAPLPAAPK